MVRPLKTAPVDLAEAQDLTAGLIERLQCPPDKVQAFLRDRKAPTLRVRVTRNGVKSFVFEAKLDRQTIRRTIGDVRSWSIEAARGEANRLRVLVDKGADPRELDRQQVESRRVDAVKAVANARTAGEAWAEYVDARKHRWGDLHYRDHIAKAKAGGETAQRGTRGRGETVGGPLYPLMAYRLADLTPNVLSEWAERETATRPTATRLSWRLLRGFLNWCAEHPDYGSILPPQNPAKAKVVREVLGKPKAKQDALQREQLAAWFSAVRQLPNPTASAYLQTLLLVGARPGEWLALRWEDLNWKWKGVTIRDKVEGTREIPLTPYVTYVLGALPRTNDWVFASATAVRYQAAKKQKEDGLEAKRQEDDDSGARKSMSMPHKAHERACTVAGIDGLTLHGLRRSFKSLTEWLEIPAGVVAQLMGHKPSATAEKHYTVRPLDLLRMHHERIEGWMLDQAGIAFDAAAAPSAVRRVA